MAERKRNRMKKRKVTETNKRIRQKKRGRRKKITRNTKEEQGRAERDKKECESRERGRKVRKRYRQGIEETLMFPLQQTNIKQANSR